MIHVLITGGAGLVALLLLAKTAQPWPSTFRHGQWVRTIDGREGYVDEKHPPRGPQAANGLTVSVRVGSRNYCYAPYELEEES